MADDNVDISGMPDPGSIGLNSQTQADPTASMPSPLDLYTHYHQYDGPTYMNPSKEDLDAFMKNPPADLYAKAPSLRKIASSLTGIPRVAAGVVASIPAAAASVAGQAIGALGAALDPDNASDYLAQGRDRGREWASKVSNLANYVPATKSGAEFSDAALSLPGNAIKDTAGELIRRGAGDNAYQFAADIGQDVGTDLPILGLPEAGRAVGRVASKVKESVTPKAAPPVPPAPDVGTPVTGDTLRAAPNPIPAPEGTLHRSATEDGRSPAAPPAAPVEPPTEPATPSAPSATEGTGQEPAAQPPAAPAAGTPSPGDAQRGSVRLFNSPAEEGPKETPTPEQQNARAGTLDDIDRLSGGMLPSRRTSALSGDYNATGDDWQLKETGNPVMQKQIADENAALHSAAENVHSSIGSEFENSVDSTTLGDRGRVTRNAIQGIEGWFDKATDQIYDTARQQNQGRPIARLQRVSNYLNDDSNFTNDAEIGLQRAAKQRLQRLWTTGDPDGNVPPGSVNAAERFREFLNDKGKNPSAMGVAGDLKNHLDMDVAEHGGPGLFETARAMRRHSYQMLEEPTGIKKLLTPGDSQGINHAIPEHKVMDYIADLPREQHEHVLNVLRAGAHLGGGELAEGCAAAIREIQAHMVSRMHAAATDDGGKWNARKFYNSADRYQRNAASTFADRPDVLRNLKTINDAGNVLHMDKHYPGAAAQTVRSGVGQHLIQGAGTMASSIAHEIPVVGRMVGRGIEAGTEKVTGKMSVEAANKEARSRMVDRAGKQRGSVQVMPSKDDFKDAEHVTMETPVSHTQDEYGHLFSIGEGKSHLRAEDTADGGLQVRGSHTAPEDQRQGFGGVLYKHAADEALGRGGSFNSDSKVSADAARRWDELRRQGYEVKRNPSARATENKGLITDDGSPVFSIDKPRAGAQVNVGLHVGDPANGGHVSDPRAVVKALQEPGVKVQRASVVQSNSEPTLVADLHRPLTAAEGDAMAKKTGQVGGLNKGSSQADTIYADQKAGLLPPAVVKSAEEGVSADQHHITNQLTDEERSQLRSDTTKRLVEAFHGTPAAAALAGAAKRGWYKNSSQAIVNNFGHEAPRFAALLSAMSPQVSVQTNFANALKTYINWDNAGRPADTASIRSIMEQSSQKSAKADPGKSNVLDAWVNNGVRALTAEDPYNVKLSGPKVHSFYNNLTNKVNEVTNDAWMAAFAKIDPAKLGGSLNASGPGKSATYLALSGKVRQAASMISRMTGETWTPAEVQETVWSWAKTAYEHAEEKGDRSIPDLVKNGDITDELIRSTPDFHQLFSSSEHRGLLQSSRFAGNDERVAGGSQQGSDAAGSSEARKAAEAALRPHLISAAERLEAVRQERRAAGKKAPKEDEDE